MGTIPLIRSSWDFLRRQPALVSVTAWMLFLPMLAVDALGSVLEGDMIPADIRTEGSIAVSLLMFFASLVAVWGQCCVFVAGRRMLQTKAGRARTSFRAVASQAKGFVIPFILTYLLRTCITLLWSLLLVVPGIVYAFRTLFTPVIVVGENIAYRAALKRSKEAVKGNAWPILKTLALLVALLFAVPFAIIAAAALPLPETPLASLAVLVVSDVWLAVAVTLLNLSLIQMYERYRAPLPR